MKNSTIRNAVTYISELFSVYLQSIQHAGKSSEIDATTGCLHVFRNFFIQYIPHDQPVVTRISELFYQVYIIADLTIELTKVQIY